MLKIGKLCWMHVVTLKGLVMDVAIFPTCQINAETAGIHVRTSADIP